MLSGFLLASILCASTKGLWLDETYTIHRSAPSLDKVIEVNRASEGSPPLYYILMHFWLMLGRGALVVRSFSILCACASLLLLYRIGRQLVNRPVALTATALMATSSVLLYFAHEARSYMLAMTLTLGSCHLALKLILESETPTLTRWIGWGLLSCLAIYTNYYTWFSIAAQVVVLGLVCWRLPDKRPRRQTAAMFLVLSVSLLLLYIPELISLKQKVVSLEIEAGGKAIQTGVPYPPDAVAAHWLSTFNQYLPFTTGFQWAKLDSKPVAIVLFCMAGLLILSFLTALARHYRSDDPAPSIAIGSLVIVPWILLVCLPYKPHQFEFKHLLFTLPWFCLGLALLVREKRAAWAPLLLFAAFNLWSDYRSMLVEEKEHWALVRETLDVDAEPGDLVLIKPAYTRIPLIYAGKNSSRSLHELYATDSTKPAALVLSRKQAAPYYRVPLDQGWKPYLRQAARRSRAIWLVQTWSNVSTPLPPISSELERVGYVREPRQARLFLGFAGSNATMIQVTCYRKQ